MKKQRAGAARHEDVLRIEGKVQLPGTHVSIRRPEGMLHKHLIGEWVGFHDERIIHALYNHLCRHGTEEGYRYRTLCVNCFVDAVEGG